MTFMRDPSSVAVRDVVGAENLMWSSDYPHNDSTWPESGTLVQTLFENVDQKERELMTSTNARRMYGFRAS